MPKIHPDFVNLAHDVAREVIDHMRTDLTEAQVSIVPEYLTERQVFEMTGFTPRALQAMRRRGDGPPFIRVGTHIRYEPKVIREWIRAGGVAAAHR